MLLSMFVCVSCFQFFVFLCFVVFGLCCTIFILPLYGANKWSGAEQTGATKSGPFPFGDDCDREDQNLSQNSDACHCPDSL